MQQKLLATLDTESTTIEEVARELAVAIATAVDADDNGGVVLIGPTSAITVRGKVLGLNLMIARPAGPLLAMQILPTYALDIATAAARARLTKRSAAIVPCAVSRPCPSFSPLPARRRRNARRGPCYTDSL